MNWAMAGLEIIDYGHGQSLQYAIKEQYDVDLDDDVCQALEHLTTDIRVARPGDNVTRLDSSHEQWLGEVVAESRAADGTVYMGVSLNQRKAEVVWDMGREDGDDHDESRNMVVELDSGKKYDEYAEYFGWEELRSISLKKLHEYPVSDELYDDILQRMGVSVDGAEDAGEALERADPTPPEEDELNVSLARKQKDQQWVLSRKAKLDFHQHGHLKVGEDNKYTATWEVDTLILFPTNGERNISDYYWLGGHFGDRTVALAKCNVGTYNYLQGVSNVYHIDKYIEVAWRLPIETNQGTTTIARSREKLALHVLPEELIPRMERVTDNIPETLIGLFDMDDGYFKRYDWDGPDAQAMMYAPVSHAEIHELMPAIRESDVMVLEGVTTVRGPRPTQKVDVKNEVHLYARARLPNWSGECDEFMAMMDYSFKLGIEDAGYHFIENMAERHDKGLPPSSEV